MKQIDLRTFTRGDLLPPGLEANARRTIAFVNEVLSTLPVRFASGFRSLARNTASNGHPRSLHMQALAADFVPTDGKFRPELLKRFASIAARHGYNCYVHDAGNGRHIHSQFHTIIK